MNKWVYKSDCNKPFEVDFYDRVGYYRRGIDANGLPRYVCRHYIFGSKEDAIIAMVKDIKIKINELLDRIPV